MSESFLQRIALYTALGLCIDQTALTYHDNLYWCFIGLFIALEWLVRREVYEDLRATLEDMRTKAGLPPKNDKD